MYSSEGQETTGLKLLWTNLNPTRTDNFEVDLPDLPKYNALVFRFYEEWNGRTDVYFGLYIARKNKDIAISQVGHYIGSTSIINNQSRKITWYENKIGLSDMMGTGNTRVLKIYGLNIKDDEQ